MSRKALSRASIAAAVALVVALALSGCLPVATTVVRQSVGSIIAQQSTADKPTAGECWQATYKSVSHYADWSTQPPVSCGAQHQLYTYAVLPLREKHRGVLYNSKNLEVQSVWDDAMTTCQQDFSIQIGDLDKLDARLQLKPYVPRRPQWAAGARWVRCDINVYAVGSPMASPELEDLPSFSVLKSQIRHSPKMFDECVDVPGGNPADGPKVAAAVWASCTADPEWVHVGDFSLTYNYGAPDPGPAGFAALYQAKCERHADSSHLTYAYYPTAAQWAANDFTFECWVGRK